ncbi:hypothetical protein ABDK56_06405 [Sphingomonas sp. ASV193]|uniref:hypothetical protein n=1 Tax=Sphingomonas sp. ASV193 TaxID=3144405 RepID=UPI0032E8EE90
MSAPTRFLVLVLGGWVVARSALLAMTPDTRLPEPAPALPERSTPALAGLDPLTLPPPGAAPVPTDAMTPLPAAPPNIVYYLPAGYAPSYAPVSAPRVRARYALADPAPGWDLADAPPAYGRSPRPLRDWPLQQVDGGSAGAPAPLGSPPPMVAAKFDRLQLTSWALVRNDRLAQSTRALAPGGTLGGSEGGMRLLYRFDRRFAASLRLTAPIGNRTMGGEAALGLRVQPFARIPLAFTAERRQLLGRSGGRSAFALFAETGLWDQPLPAGMILDAYAQGGVVGLKHRDLFAEGSATATRKFLHRFWAGIGVWGGIQPGVSRLDIGPRLSVRPRKNLRVHLDYRYKAAGNARPGSGPVITLAGDF